MPDSPILGPLVLGALLVLGVLFVLTKLTTW